jgi:hypothetical protein
MQNSEKLRQKDHDVSRKTTCRERGEKYHFQRGGGINILFRPKYRPLGACQDEGRMQAVAYKRSGEKDAGMCQWLAEG